MIEGKKKETVRRETKPLLKCLLPVVVVVSADRRCNVGRFRSNSFISHEADA